MAKKKTHFTSVRQRNVIQCSHFYYLMFLIEGLVSTFQDVYLRIIQCGITVFVQLSVLTS